MSFCLLHCVLLTSSLWYRRYKSFTFLMIFGSFIEAFSVLHEQVRTLTAPKYLESVVVMVFVISFVQLLTVIDYFSMSIWLSWDGVFCPLWISSGLSRWQHYLQKCSIVSVYRYAEWWDGGEEKNSCDRMTGWKTYPSASVARKYALVFAFCELVLPIALCWPVMKMMSPWLTLLSVRWPRLLQTIAKVIYLPSLCMPAFTSELTRLW